MRGGFDHAIGDLQPVLVGRGTNLAEDFAKGERAQAAPDRHQADKHAEIAHAVDDKGLVGRVGRATAFVPETDQQIGADAHQFPKHEHHGHVAGDHQSQHAETEQRKALEEAAEAAAAPHRLTVGQRREHVEHLGKLAVHVADGINVDARGNQRNHAEHGQRQPIDVVADG